MYAACITPANYCLYLYLRRCIHMLAEALLSSRGTCNSTRESELIVLMHHKYGNGRERECATGA